MFWQTIDPHYAIVGFIVGGLVGVTGVGGGSLTTPILILLFGISPVTAVGTDLLFAAPTKSVGSIVHGFNRTMDWRVVRRLATGSIPATHSPSSGVLVADGRRRGSPDHHRNSRADAPPDGRVADRPQPDFVLYAERLSNLDEHSTAILTVVMGAVLGVLVTFSSVGAGAIGVTALMLLYPRISAARIVGSDIAHAVPLTLIAGLGHGAMGSVDMHALVSLLAGSLPGIFLASSISPRVPDLALRYVLAAVLIIVGARLALDVVASPRPDISVDNFP